MIELDKIYNEDFLTGMQAHKIGATTIIIILNLMI